MCCIFIPVRVSVGRLMNIKHTLTRLFETFFLKPIFYAYSKQHKKASHCVLLKFQEIGILLIFQNFRLTYRSLIWILHNFPSQNAKFSEKIFSLDYFFTC